MEKITSKPHPWVHYWARMLDYSLAMIFCYSFLFPFLFPHIVPFSLLLLFLPLFLWVFIEAFLLSSWGNTPGKWLFRIWVRDLSGKKLTFRNALNRSLSVWWLGLGAGAPIISFITMIVAYAKLTNSGMTSWDSRGGIEVLHQKVGAMRIIAAILYFLAYFSLTLSMQAQ
ncbi:MAG: RDD family protein [Simkania negevensis]|nr:RDD family protein [Simkania negevensis]